MGRNFSKLTAGLLALALSAGTAHGAAPAPRGPSVTAPVAPPPSTTEFNLVGDTIIVPLPEGYCTPRGRFEGMAQLTAAADKENLTTATLYRCDDIAADQAPSRYALIKTPRNMLLVRATRKELLDAMGAVPASDLAAALDPENLGREASKSATDVLGAETEIGVSIKPVAADQYGYYLSGIGQASVGGATFKICFAAVMTTIKGHVISYYFYAPGQSLTDIANVLALTKAEVRRLIKANDD